MDLVGSFDYFFLIYYFYVCKSTFIFFFFFTLIVSSCEEGLYVSSTVCQIAVQNWFLHIHAR